MTDLRISNDLALPVDYVTKTAAIVAQRRKGKTYTANVIAEELVDAGQPWVALDPTGAWWGLRSSADGERPGLPVVILGGQHGDAPLERTAGKFVAELVVEHPGWYVLDLSLLDSRAAEREFATDFGEALIRRKRQPGRDFPLHLFVDEADMFAPQEREGQGDNRMLGAYQAIVRRGGLHGLGTTLISQRPALLNKSVLTQLDLLVLLRLVAGQDQDAVDRDYIKRNATAEERKLLMESLASLRLGEAWLWEPGADPALLERVQIRERRTFNSSATPKVGELRVEPKRLADVDLDAVKDAMAETIEKARADDPKELRRRIADLERQLAAAPPAAEPETIEVVPPGLLEVIKSAGTTTAAIEAAITENLPRLMAAYADAERLAFGLPASTPTPERTPARTPQRPTPALRSAPPQVPPRPASTGSGGAGGLPGPQRKLLTVLAVYGPRSKRQLAMQAGYSAKGGGFNNPLSALRSAGLVERGDPIVITAAGLDALGDWDPLPTGQALVDHWLGQLSGPERRILQPLLDAWPAGMSKEDLAAAAGYAPVGGGFNNPLSRLRSLELVAKGPEIRLTDDFGEAIR